MKLSKNDKKTLKLLLGNGRITDTEIAEKLRITKQAVGKIRKKLESSGIILGYSTKVDYFKMGIHAFAAAIMHLTQEGMNRFSEAVLEQMIKENQNVLYAYKLPEGLSAYLVVFGFRDISELDRLLAEGLFSSQHKNCIELNKIYSFSGHSIIKENPAHLLNKVLGELDRENLTQGW